MGTRFTGTILYTGPHLSLPKLTANISPVKFLKITSEYVSEKSEIKKETKTFSRCVCNENIICGPEEKRLVVFGQQKIKIHAENNYKATHGTVRIRYFSGRVFWLRRDTDRDGWMSNLPWSFLAGPSQKRITV